MGLFARRNARDERKYLVPGGVKDKNNAIVAREEKAKRDRQHRNARQALAKKQVDERLARKRAARRAARKARRGRS